MTKLRPYQSAAAEALRKAFESPGTGVAIEAPMGSGRQPTTLVATVKMIAPGIQALRMTGRCANGFERDGGRLWHAVRVESNKALCGKKPGRSSAGWGADVGDAVTCPVCVRRLKKTAP